VNVINKICSVCMRSRTICLYGYSLRIIVNTMEWTRTEVVPLPAHDGSMREQCCQPVPTNRRRVVTLVLSLPVVRYPHATQLVYQRFYAPYGLLHEPSFFISNPCFTCGKDFKLLTGNSHYNFSSFCANITSSYGTVVLQWGNFKSHFFLLNW
jgi:hypothetical protein